MTASTRSHPPRLMFIGAAVIALASLLAGILALPLMSRPVVAVQAEPFFIAVDSPQSGGTLWFNVASAKPIDITSDTPVQVEVTVSSDRDVEPVLIFGGSAASSLIACEGNGAFLDPNDSPVGYASLSQSSGELVTRYFQRRPSRGLLIADARRDTLTREAALALAKATTYRTDTISLPTAETLTWDYRDEEKKEIPARTATLTCSFEASAFIAQQLYAKAYRNPDLFAAISEMNGGGPVRVQYEMQFARSDQFNTPVQTFPDLRQYVDDTTGERLITITEDWWARNLDDYNAVLISSGSMVVEPRDAETWRVLARLLVGLFASLFVALSVILVRKTLYYYM